ncbi:ParB/RepB/Spo0J family partition protein [Candidatus Paracaedibacter symbiosus]|uniref:ParB/RepB/Spo0J family partition protein n=1 Tax=Candidatus Paracaedibacter symbiosus TaxID=244582 RepID=UPI0012EB6468|nr:ParB/RepB/Spo0J family partition protein [Candidatus Paracaedibacter symbiosus]
MLDEMKQRKHQSLGRGLSALLGESLQDESPATANGESWQVDINLIRPGKYQPRQRFNEEQLDSLIDSIRQKGIIQPLVIRPLNDNKNGPYEIIAGERRWRAAKTLNLDTVPAIIRICSDEEALETALIENIQRDDLSPIEEAEGYQRLLHEFNYTQEQLAKSVGKSRSHVANTLRLNNLPAHVKGLINDGKISAGHARALMTSENMDGLVEKIVNEKLNVRDAERLAKKQSWKLCRANLMCKRNN